MKYFITILFESGNKVVARSEAQTEQEAYNAIINDEQFKQFAQEDNVLDIFIEPDDTPDVEVELLLQPSKDAGWWVLTDTLHNVVLKWQEGQFNDTQRVTYLEDTNDPLLAAEINRKMADWLLANHKELL